MTDEELVKQLRDEALDLHRSAWRDISGGQNATISATLADTTANRIEALTAERDQWIQHAKNAVWADSEELKQAEADNARLRELLKECSEDLGAYVNNEYPAELRNKYPALEDKYSYFMEPVLKARAALNGESHDS